MAEEKQGYLPHHFPQIQYWAAQPGTPEELADRFMAQLAHSVIYPQTPEMRQAVVDAILDFRAENVRKVEESQQGMRFDRLCRVCRNCFKGD